MWPAMAGSMAEPPARAGSIGMSSTLRKGVPRSLAASLWKSALLGKGRPRMLRPWGTTGWKERLGGRTTRRRAQRAHSSVTDPRDERTGHSSPRKFLATTLPFLVHRLTHLHRIRDKTCFSGWRAAAGLFRELPTQRLSPTRAESTGIRFALRDPFFYFCGGPCRGKTRDNK